MRSMVRTSLSVPNGQRRGRPAAGQLRCAPTRAIGGTPCTRSGRAILVTTVTLPVSWHVAHRAEDRQDQEQRRPPSGGLVAEGDTIGATMHRVLESYSPRVRR